MFCKEQTFRHENHNNKPRKTHRNIPSFSSTLLDEICRSIDGPGGGPEDFPAHGGTPAGGCGAKNGGSMREREEESVARISRACLVEKWMEKQADEKNVARKLEKSIFPDNDLLFFSSSSSSSDSSGALSSSDTEFFGSTKVSRSATRPKPIRTGLSLCENDEGAGCLLYEKNRVEDDLIKSRSRALKIYSNLKRLKQPISPGGKLTSLINSLFTSTNRKKSKDQKRNQTAPSSASSFSRSCLMGKCPPKSSERERNGVQRSVRFHPVGVIVDQDSKPCGKKCIYNEGCDRYNGRPPLPPNALAELKTREKNRNVEDQRNFGLSMFSKIENDDDDDDDDDAFSVSSSDLFELDHLSLLGNNDRFCEELPVYETTYFDKNRCLIR